MNRRRFVLGMTGSALLYPFLPALGSAPGAARYVSPRADSSGRYYLTAFDEAGRVRFELPLPGRGHGIAVRPQGDELVQVARRPGRYLLVVDTVTGELRDRLRSGSGRHFYGHAQFSADGRFLYTPENDYEQQRGVIGVRDAHAGYRQVDELPSHGIGPHDLKLLSDNRTLVVANGGILTHPETPRAKLNLNTMSPSLAYVDRESGRLLESHRLPREHHQNSIRHLAITADDKVCFVTQYQGSRRDRPPLVGLHRRGEELTLCRAPEAIQTRMRNYCGSVCADSAGKWFAVSSPRGNLVTFWEAEGGAYVGHTEVTDGCGIAAGSAPGEFLLSSGLGAMIRYRLVEQQSTPLKELVALGGRWDNHMFKIERKDQCSTVSPHLC